MPKPKPSFNFRKFYNTAEQLLSHKRLSEANQRSAISRAYYAAFHCAHSYLKSHNKFRIRSNHSVHTNVIDSLHYAGLKSLSSALDFMRQNRNLADYSVEIESIEQKVAFTMHQAKIIISQLTK